MRMKTHSVQSPRKLLDRSILLSAWVFLSDDIPRQSCKDQLLLGRMTA